MPEDKSTQTNELIKDSVLEDVELDGVDPFGLRSVNNFVKTINSNSKKIMKCDRAVIDVVTQLSSRQFDLATRYCEIFGEQDNLSGKQNETDKKLKTVVDVTSEIHDEQIDLKEASKKTEKKLKKLKEKSSTIAEGNIRVEERFNNNKEFLEQRISNLEETVKEQKQEISELTKQLSEFRGEFKGFIEAFSRRGSSCSGSTRSGSSYRSHRSHGDRSNKSLPRIPDELKRTAEWVHSNSDGQGSS